MMKSKAQAAAGPELPAALGIARGVCRLLSSLGQAPLTEFTLRTGRRVDIMALAGDGALTVVEVKSSLADFRADQKWPEYLDFCDFFYFAVAEDFPQEVLPDDQGLIIADAYGAAILRPAQASGLAPARRKALTLRFGQTAAGRLLSVIDPGHIDL